MENDYVQGIIQQVENLSEMYLRQLDEVLDISRKLRDNAEEAGIGEEQYHEISAVAVGVVSLRERVEAASRRFTTCIEE